MFALDPTSGNTLGFKASSFLYPSDAFDMVCECVCARARGVSVTARTNRAAHNAHAI